MFHDLEKKFISLSSKIFKWYRYRDDILCLWLGDEDELARSFVRAYEDYQQNISENLLHRQVLVEPANGFVVQFHNSLSTVRWFEDRTCLNDMIQSLDLSTDTVW